MDRNIEKAGLMHWMTGRLAVSLSWIAASHAPPLFLNIIVDVTFKSKTLQKVLEAYETLKHEKEEEAKKNKVNLETFYLNPITLLHLLFPLIPTTGLR